MPFQNPDRQPSAGSLSEIDELPSDPVEVFRKCYFEPERWSVGWHGVNSTDGIVIRPTAHHVQGIEVSSAERVMLFKYLPLTELGKLLVNVEEAEFDQLRKRVEQTKNAILTTFNTVGPQGIMNLLAVGVRGFLTKRWPESTEKIRELTSRLLNIWTEAQLRRPHMVLSIYATNLRGATFVTNAIQMSEADITMYFENISMQLDRIVDEALDLLDSVK